MKSLLERQLERAVDAAERKSRAVAAARENVIYSARGLARSSANDGPDRARWQHLLSIAVKALDAAEAAK